MKSALQTFEAGLEGLKEYLDSTDNDAKLLAKFTEKGKDILNEEELKLLKAINEAHVKRKQYIYTVAIISLYGLLERYINSIIDLHIQKLASIVSTYEHMPQAIIEGHVTKTLDLVKALTEDKFQNGSLTPALVIENLHLCLSLSPKFQVNGSAFCLHRGNLTLTKIGEFLNGVGIHHHLRRIIHAKPMVKYLESRFPERDISNISDQDLRSIFEPVNSLVQRRNEASHGVINIDDLESISLLKDRCDFIGSYIHSLHYIFLQEIARAYSNSPVAAQHLGKPIAVYDNSIVCFEVASGTISTHDLLIAKTSMDMEPFRFGEIENIQVDRKDHQSISITSATKFGVKIGFRAKEKYEYWIVKKLDKQ